MEQTTTTTDQAALRDAQGAKGLQNPTLAEALDAEARRVSFEAKVHTDSVLERFGKALRSVNLWDLYSVTRNHTEDVAKAYTYQTCANELRDACANANDPEHELGHADIMESLPEVLQQHMRRAMGYQPARSTSPVHNVMDDAEVLAQRWVVGQLHRVMKALVAVVDEGPIDIVGTEYLEGLAKCRACLAMLDALPAFGWRW